MFKKRDKKAKAKTPKTTAEKLGLKVEKVPTEAEQIARDERGCVGARLETWGFQARPFYEARGYTVFGVLEDYPPGETEYHLSKRLD